MTTIPVTRPAAPATDTLRVDRDPRPTSSAAPGRGAATRARYAVDSFVARYAAVWAFGVADPDRVCEPYYRRFVDTALAGGLTPARVLDVGCGPGRVVADLARRVPSARCTAVDASATMAALAAAVLHTRAGEGLLVDAGDFGFAPARVPTSGRTDVVVLQRRLEDLPAGSGTGYDLVTASHLLDRVDCPASAVADLCRLVAPGGRLVVSCAFNYESRSQWSVPDGAALARLVAAQGLEIEDLDDDVEYRERLDIRGTVTSHRVALLSARRPA